MNQCMKTLLLIISIVVALASFTGCNNTTTDTSSVNESVSANEVVNNTDSSTSTESPAESENSLPNPNKDKEVLSAFNSYFESMDIKFDMTDEQIADFAKTVRLSDGTSIFDKGINVRYDNYNGKGITYGSDGNYVGRSGNYYGYFYETSSLTIADANAKIEYPLDIKPGDSLSDVMKLLEITDEYEKSRNDKTVQADAYGQTYLYGDENEHLGYILHYKSHPGEEAELPLDYGHITLTYVKQTVVEDERILTQNVGLYFIDGKVKDISISENNKSIRGENYEPEKVVKFYFDNAKYFYNDSSGVYVKINEINASAGELKIKYSAYSDTPVTTEINLYTLVSDDQLGCRKSETIQISEKEKTYELYIKSFKSPNSDTYEINFSMGGNQFKINFMESHIYFNEGRT